MVCEGSWVFWWQRAGWIVWVADSVNRLSIALICYVVLGVLTWATIADSKLRAGTLVVLALFAVKSVLRRKQVLHPDEGTDAD
jgi:hypothetical protein